MARKRVTVIQESTSGRNKRFRDNFTNVDMTQKQFVKEIKKGNYVGKYHIRMINSQETPVSNPDPIKENNLG